MTRRRPFGVPQALLGAAAPRFLLAVLACLLVAPPVSAQAGTTIHLEFEGGPYPGTYDVSAAEPCLVYGDGTWVIQVDDPSQTPGYVRLDVGGVAAMVSVAGWPEGDGYTFFEFELDVEEQGDDAILTISAVIDDYGLDGDETVTGLVRVECRGFDDQRIAPPTPEVTLEPPPTPQVQGPPAEGSTAIELSLGFGPWAGEHVSWTLDDACFVSDGTWMVAVHDVMSIPSHVSLLAAEATAEDPSIGMFTASFGTPPESTSYESSGGATFVLDADGRASVSDAAAIARLPDGTQAQGRLDARIACAGIVP